MNLIKVKSFLISSKTQYSQTAQMAIIKSISLIILLSFCWIGCKSNQQLILSDGIYIESFDSTNLASNTIDNKIYKAGKTFTYNFYYQDLDNRNFLFEEEKEAYKLPFIERIKAWYFVPLDSITDQTISQVTVSIEPDIKKMKKRYPNYDQTVITYNYPQNNGEQRFNESTGLIENSKNVWMHPPRKKLFRILELNPFPFIQAPYKVGNKWEWTLNIGSFWGDKRWKTWKKSITNKYNYEITGIKKVESKFGYLKCYEVKSTAKSELGETSLIAYFNLKYGFIKLAYTNIDSSKINIELLEISD